MGPAQRTNRLGIAPSRPSDKPSGAQRQADHDHRAPDPEPFDVAGHDAPRDVAEPLPGEDCPGEQNQEPNDADADPHRDALPIVVTYPTPP